MASKAIPFNDMITTTAASIVCCVETHFTANTNVDQFLTGTEFDMACCNRQSHGGGVAIAYHRALKMEQIILPELTDIEAVCCRNDTTCICVIYWPPSSTRDTKDLEVLTEFLSEYYDTHSVIILGDFNLPSIQWSSDYEQSPYLIPDSANARPFERESILTFESRGLIQVNQNPNPQLRRTSNW